LSATLQKKRKVREIPSTAAAGFRKARKLHSRTQKSTTAEDTLGGDSTLEQHFTPGPEHNDVQEGPNDSDQTHPPLKGGDAVELIFLGTVVGTAVLQISSNPEDRFKTCMHNISLNDFEKDGEKLVSCYRYTMAAGTVKSPYPYSHGGVEIPPKTMEGVFGFLAWDLHNMRHIRN